MDSNTYDSDLQFLSFFDPETDQLEAVATCKFVLLEHDGRKILVAGLLDQFPYHANLLSRFCDDHKIPSVWVRHPDMVEVLDGEVQLAGGGYLKLTGDMRVDIYGSSTAYGHYDTGLMSRFVRHHPFFTSREVSQK